MKVLRTILVEHIPGCRLLALTPCPASRAAYSLVKAVSASLDCAYAAIRSQCRSSWRSGQLISPQPWAIELTLTTRAGAEPASSPVSRRVSAKAARKLTCHSVW